MNKEETKFISLSVAAKELGRTPEYLNSLVRQGKFKAEKLGRNWHTKREWIDEFSASLNNSKNKSGENTQLLPKKGSADFSEKIPAISISPAKEEIFQSEEKSPVKFFQKKSLKTNPLLKERKSLWLQLATKSTWLLAFFLLTFSGLTLVSFFLRNTDSQLENIALEISEDTFLSRDGEGVIFQSGKVLGEEVATANAIATSEDFRLQEFSFGGVVLASVSEESLPLEITNFKTKVFLTKDGKEAQVLISWQTNKLAVSEIEYAKINSVGGKKLQEENFAFNHSVILTQLDLDTTYGISVQAQDRWSNTMTSDKFSIYTGSKAVSVFDLIVKEMNNVFGWAMK